MNGTAVSPPAGEAQERQRRGRPWVWGIVGGYSLFALLTLGMVAFAMSRSVDLVSEDYYQKGIAQQQHIERVARTTALAPGADWSILHVDGVFLFRLAPAHFDGVPEGRIQFYRPGDSSLDRQFRIALDAAGEQRVAADLAPGRWRVRIEWRADGLDYYSERDLSVGT